MKKKYLVIKTEYFYDGHGEPDEGAVTKYVTDDKIFATLDPKEVYDDDEYEPLEDNYDDDYRAQDGYNCTSVELTFRELSEDEANDIEKIINSYNNLYTLK